MAEHVQEDHASTDEAAAALEQLGTADKVRLEKIARNRVRGLQHVEWSDLLQEAVRRVIEGTRKWPLQVSIVVFMAGVMRSIANEYWEQHYRTEEAGVLLETDAQLPSDSVPVGIIDAAPSSNPGPDRELDAQHELEAIEELFTDDEDALAIVMAKAEGYSPIEIQKEFDMNSTQYASALKKIRRRLLRHETEKAEQ